MTNEMMTCPSESHYFDNDETQDDVVTSIEGEAQEDDNFSTSTGIAGFSKISHLLSSRAIRRPKPASPTNEELKRLAKANRPPSEWYESEEEKPF